MIKIITTTLKTKLENFNNPFDVINLNDGDEPVLFKLNSSATGLLSLYQLTKNNYSFKIQSGCIASRMYTEFRKYFIKSLW